MTPIDSLVRDAREGDTGAFAELVRRTQDRLLMTARALTGDLHAAEDAVQEAYVAAHRGLRDLREPSRFRAWITRILVRTANAARRRPSPRPLGDAAARLPARPAGRHERLDALVEEVERLPEKYRAPLALHYLADLPYREVAEVLGIPEKRVKSRLYDARETLRRRLGDG